MTTPFAKAIGQWHYEGVYSFYDLGEDVEDRREFLDPANWNGAYYAVLDQEGQLVGYFVFSPEEDVLVLGLGMRPDLTGRGLGADFIDAGLAFAQEHYTQQKLRLSVATFNRRAIRAYEQAGFVRGRIVQQETNGGTYEFVEMTKAC
jgi:ribosomal-protein-alanine N-acetyltransferase